MSSPEHPDRPSPVSPKPASPGPAPTVYLVRDGRGAGEGDYPVDLARIGNIRTSLSHIFTEPTTLMIITTGHSNAINTALRIFRDFDEEHPNFTILPTGVGDWSLRRIQDVEGPCTQFDEFTYLRRIRRWLRQQRADVIVIFSHAGFLERLAPDNTSFRWEPYDHRLYSLVEGPTGEVSLIEVAYSVRLRMRQQLTVIP